MWRRVIDINLSGTCEVARESALRMRAGGGGAIINIGLDLASLRGELRLLLRCEGRCARDDQGHDG